MTYNSQAALEAGPKVTALHGRCLVVPMLIPLLPIHQHTGRARSSNRPVRRDRRPTRADSFRQKQLPQPNEQEAGRPGRAPTGPHSRWVALARPPCAPGPTAR